MNSTSKLSLKTRLIFGFGVIISSIIILIVVSYVSVKRIENQSSDIFLFDKISKSLMQLRSDENRLQVLSLELFFEKDIAGRDSEISKILASADEVKKLTTFIDSSLADYREEQIMFREINSSIAKYSANRDLFIGLVKQGKSNEAYSYIDKVQSPLYEGIRDNIVKLEKQLDDISNKHYRENSILIKTIDYTLFLLGLCIIIISVILAVFMLNMLKKIASEIRIGVNVLGTSASEILSTVTEISTGASETAAAVSETTTTVEEVRHTAMVSSQKAQSLVDSSQRAADSVEKGRDAINEVIESMRQIDNQMNVISETVTKLSEQNRTIGEITSSVADIADQSNLLAVNAAIEAAKAGEHGRGFTVVAQEIRVLADQSKKATAQVKEILNEINKSINQAVGVTEQGSKTVNEGRKLVDQSGEVIELLADNVEETAQASIQISSSNQQQMAGIDQIVPAMENIKQASQQNVTGIKQTQQAAQDLNKLGDNLKDIIERFNL